MGRHPWECEPLSVVSKRGRMGEGETGENFGQSLKPITRLPLSDSPPLPLFVPSYNDRMPETRTTTGIFLVIVLAVVGYVLWTMPHQLIDGWHKAADLSPWAGYIYL